MTLTKIINLRNFSKNLREKRISDQNPEIILKKAVILRIIITIIERKNGLMRDLVRVLATNIRNMKVGMKVIKKI